MIKLQQEDLIDLHKSTQVFIENSAKLHVKSASFSTDNDQTSRLFILYCISDHKNFIPKHLDNALTDFA